MTEELPIACSLSAGDLTRRLAQIGELGRSALVDVRTDEFHATLRFAAGDGIRERVQAIAAAESQCCAFLHMSVSEEPDSVVLRIDAPDGAQLVLDELIEAFRGHPKAAR